MSSTATLTDVVLVAIGRNEGERLRRCIASAVGCVSRVVYVDSGSTDGSVEVARALGADVVALDLQQPFTAARARNAGAAAAFQQEPSARFVQFVDGDCELARAWLETARAFLESHAEVVAVCGRRRERHPDRSIYNWLCDIEWNTPVGAARAFGGDVMIRAEAFRTVSGYRGDLIAGEDPELAIRLRHAGGQVWRIDAEMTLHDAAMTRFAQWWKRTVRAGYAYALGSALHGAPPERHWVQESRRAWLWGLVLPMMALLAALTGQPLLAVAVLALYPLQVLRLTLRGNGPWRQRAVSAVFLVVGKFAEAWGQVQFGRHRLRGEQGRLIEYK